MASSISLRGAGQRLGHRPGRRADHQVDRHRPDAVVQRIPRRAQQAGGARYPRRSRWAAARPPARPAPRPAPARRPRPARRRAAPRRSRASAPRCSSTRPTSSRTAMYSGCTSAAFSAQKLRSTARSTRPPQRHRMPAATSSTISTVTQRAASDTRAQTCVGEPHRHLRRGADQHRRHHQQQQRRQRQLRQADLEQDVRGMAQQRMARRARRIILEIPVARVGEGHRHRSIKGGVAV